MEHKKHHPLQEALLALALSGQITGIPKEAEADKQRIVRTTDGVVEEMRGLLRVDGHSDTQVDMTTHEPHDTASAYAEEVRHPFHRNPEAWLDEHAEEIERCFDCSGAPVTGIEVDCMDERIVLQAMTEAGVRRLRMPGSGILEWKTEEGRARWLQEFAAYVKGLQAHAPTPIRVVFRSHAPCGAAGIKYHNEKNPNKAAAHAIEAMADDLKAMGAAVEYGGESEMNGMEHHTALTMFIEKEGRLQRVPLNTYVAAGGNLHQAALLALDIAAGEHSYGSHLKQFTFVVFDDPSDPHALDEEVRKIEEGAKEKYPEVKVKVVRRALPLKK